MIECIEANNYGKRTNIVEEWVWNAIVLLIIVLVVLIEMFIRYCKALVPLESDELPLWEIPVQSSTLMPPG